MSRRGRRRKYNSKEYSKQIVYWTGVLFLSQLFLAAVAIFGNKDTSILMYSIPSTGGVFGASIIFYLNKAKLENVLKMKISYTKFKINISKLIPYEAALEIENEFIDLENALNLKLTDTMSTAVNKDIDIQSY